MSTTPPDLTPAEFNVMKTLWSREHATVADVRADLAVRGTDVAYTTVMTLLGRLAGKGAVQVDRTREPFVYSAAHRRESVLRDRLRDFVRDVFDGEADALVLGLVADGSLARSLSKESKDALRAIEDRVAQAEKSEAGKAAAPRPVVPSTKKRSR